MFRVHLALIRLRETNSPAADSWLKQSESMTRASDALASFEPNRVARAVPAQESCRRCVVGNHHHRSLDMVGPRSTCSTTATRASKSRASPSARCPLATRCSFPMGLRTSSAIRSNRTQTIQGVRPGPSTPDAAEGPTAASSRVCCGFPGILSIEDRSRAPLKARACCWFESCERRTRRASPVRRDTSGGLSRRLSLWVHDSNQQQALVSSRSCPRRARVRNARVTNLYRASLMAAHPRASLGRCLSPAGSAARALQRGLRSPRAEGVS